MKPFQERTLDNLSALINRKGFECVIQYCFSNTGTLEIHAPGAFVSSASLSFDFQDGVTTFSLTIGDRKVPSQEGRNDYFDFRLEHRDGDGWKRFLDVLDLESLALAAELGIEPPSCEPYGTSDIDSPLREAFENLIGIVDTPIGRRKLGLDTNADWLNEARRILRNG